MLAPGVRQRGHVFSRRYPGNTDFPRYNFPLDSGSVQLATGYAATHGSRCGWLDRSSRQDGGIAGPHILSSCGANRPSSANFPYRRESLRPTTSHLLIFFFLRCQQLAIPIEL